MSSSEIYKKKFNELLDVEEKARDMYKYYLDRLKDRILLEKLNEIYSDELEHVEIIKNFIGYAQK